MNENEKLKEELPAETMAEKSQKKQRIKQPFKHNTSFPTGWSKEDMEFLYSARDDGMEYELIALSLKKTTNEVKRVYRGYPWEHSEFYDPALNRIKQGIKRTHLEKIVQLREKKSKTDLIITDILVDKLCQRISPFPLAPSVWRPSREVKQQRPEDVVLMLSDTHIGHNHTLSETNGLSEYNSDIFKKRVNNLKKITSEIVELHSRLYDTPTLHIACLGDIVDGMNSTGEWSPVYINLPIYDQWALACDSLADMIYYWLGMFDNINFYGIRGNHSRAAPKGVEKDYVNWDLLTYKFLELRFKNEPRVKFNVPQSWFLMAKIRSHNFLMVHGDEIGAGGPPVMKIQECESRMMGLVREIPDYTLAGHFHNAAEMQTNHGKVIINGSFLGGDVFSLKSMQRGCKPIQKIFGVHDKHGITWTYDINLAVDK